MANDKPPLKTIYTTSEPNALINLYDGDIRLEQSGHVFTGHASIKLNWLPSTCIRFEMLDRIFGDTGKVKLEIAKLPLSCDAYVDLVSCGYIIRGQLLGRPTIINTSVCDEVLFHIPNFKSIPGIRLNLKNDEWNIILSPIDNITDLTKYLSDQGGFGLTHIGMLKRIDEGHFDKDQASDKLIALYHFLSFVRGLWCGPILPIGQNGDKVSWQVWDAPRLTPWKDVRSWFFDFEPEKINEAFIGFMKKWVDPDWNEPTRLAIHWYIEANIGSGGVEGSIILIQAALELLAWVYLMEAPGASKPCTVEAFHKWPASRKIEHLLTSMGIPVTIPSELKELQRALTELQKTNSDAKKYPSGSYMFTYIRNRITHETGEDRIKLSAISFDARIEAKELGLWYVEMTFLRIFGFNGQHYMRFRNGGPADRVAYVPWVKVTALPR